MMCRLRVPDNASTALLASRRRVALVKTHTAGGACPWEALLANHTQAEPAVAHHYSETTEMVSFHTLREVD